MLSVALFERIYDSLFQNQSQGAEAADASQVTFSASQSQSLVFKGTPELYTILRSKYYSQFSLVLLKIKSLSGPRADFGPGSFL